MAQLAISLAGAAVGNFLLPGIGGQIGFAIGSFVGGQLTQTDPPTLYGPKIEDGKVSSSAYGKMIPHVWGTVDIAGNIIDTTELVTESTETEVGGKGGPSQTTVSYTQYIDYDVALCAGAEGIVQIFANEQLIYDASPGSAVKRPEWLDFIFYTGSETQEVDATFEAARGVDEVPAYRGTAHVVFRRFRVTEFGTVAVNLRFVVTTNGTASIASKEYTQDSTGLSPHTMHNTYTDLVIGSYYKNLDTVNGDEVMLRAYDPYSQTTAWTLTITDADIYQHASWVVQCGFPGVDELGQPLTAPNSILAIYHRFNSGTPNNRYARFVYADSGIEIGKVQLSTSESGFSFTSAYSDDAVFFQNRVLVASASMARHAVDKLMTISSVAVTAPAGYDWGGTDQWNTVAKPGSVFFGNAAVILAVVENQSTSAFGFVTWEDEAPGFGATSYTPDFNAVDELAAADGTPRGGVYDQTEDCFWVLSTDAQTQISRVELDGTITSTTDWNASFSISGDAIDIAIDQPRDLLWVVISGVAYAWPTYDTSATPTSYGTGLQPYGLSWHPGSGTLWAGSEVSTEDSHWQYQLQNLTGGGETLQQVVEDICDEAGTNLLTADRVCTALSAITVDGFRVTTIAQRRAAIDALRSAYLFDFVPRDGALTAVLRGGSSALTLDDDTLGAHIYGSSPQPRLEITREAEDRIPKLLGVSFIDASQNYEAGYEQATRQASAGGTESRVEIPVVLSHDDGAQLSSVLLHVQNVESEKYSGWAMPSTYASVIPAGVVTASVDGTTYPMRVESANIIDGRIIEFQGLRHDASIYTDFTVGGTTRDRARSVESVGTTQLIALDTPAARQADIYPGYYVAGASYSPTWDGAVIFESADGLVYSNVATLDTEATYGFVTEALPSGDLTDLDNTLSVQLVSGSLSSLTHDTMQTNKTANYAFIGAPGRWEVIKFQTASLSGGIYSLTILHRSLRDSGAANGSSAAGDKFILINTTSLRRVSLPTTEISSTRWLKAVSIGRDVDATTANQFATTGRSVDPFTPCSLHAVNTGDWDLYWHRQDKKQARFLQQPEMTEDTESYLIDILDLGGTVVRSDTSTSETYEYTSANQTTDFGGAVSVLKWRVAQASALVTNGPYAYGASGTYSTDYDGLATGRAALVDFWPFDETSGTNAASDSGTHDGTYTNDYTINSTSLTLDGSPSVRINPTSNTGYVNITPGSWSAAIRAVDFVLRPNDFSATAQDQGVVWASTSLGGGAGWAVMLTQAGNLTFRADPTDVYTGPDTEITSATALTLSEIYHVQINWGATSGDDVEIYINGVLDASGTMASSVTFPSTGFFRVGGMLTHLRSNIAKLGTYNANLTAADAIAGAVSAKGLT